MDSSGCRHPHRYELVDKAIQDDRQVQRTALVADLLNSVINEETGEKVSTSEKDVIESGHQIVSHLVSLQTENPAKTEKSMS